MKKNKLIARIIAGLLVLITILGLIIPYVSADEIDGQPNNELPVGFEYVFEDGEWKIKKSEGNNKPAVYVNSPYGFDTSNIVIFICNIETEEVISRELFQSANYITSLNIGEGYYVIYANGYAWSDKDGNAYAVNGGEYYYVYIGDNYDNEKYTVNFADGNEIIELSLSVAPDNFQVVKYQSQLSIGNSDLICPSDALLEPIQKIDPNGGGTNQPPTGDKEKPPVEGGDDEDNGGIIGVLKKMFTDIIKKSAIPLILIAICYAGLTFIKIKKQYKVDQQQENDELDDKCVD
jgi:hypothetical protein